MKLALSGPPRELKHLPVDTDQSSESETVIGGTHVKVEGRTSANVSFRRLCEVET
jgi:hypothetical protein